MSAGAVLISAVLALMLILFLQFQYMNRHIIAAGKKLPCPTTLPVLGNALLFIGGVNSLRTVLTNLTGKFKEPFCIWIGLAPVFVVSNPADVQIVLNSTSTLEKDETYVFLKRFFGNGILVSQGKNCAIFLKKTVMVHILRKFEVKTNMRLEDIEYEINLPRLSKILYNLNLYQFML